jgi:Acyl-[acyl carrier protein]--UDP-N-acetylglucosamine O-acyltransferase
MVTNFISEKAKIGDNVQIWHFSYVGDDVEIGDNVKIGSLAHIDYDVKLETIQKLKGKHTFHII